VQNIKISTHNLKGYQIQFAKSECPTPKGREADPKIQS